MNLILFLVSLAIVIKTPYICIITKTKKMKRLEKEIKEAMDLGYSRSKAISFALRKMVGDGMKIPELKAYVDQEGNSLIYQWWNAPIDFKEYVLYKYIGSYEEMMSKRDKAKNDYFNGHKKEGYAVVGKASARGGCSLVGTNFRHGELFDLSMYKVDHYYYKGDIGYGYYYISELFSTREEAERLKAELPNITSWVLYSATDLRSHLRNIGYSEPDEEGSNHQELFDKYFYRTE